MFSALSAFSAFLKVLEGPPKHLDCRTLGSAALEDAGGLRHCQPATLANQALSLPVRQIAREPKTFLTLFNIFCMFLFVFYTFCISKHFACGSQTARRAKQVFGTLPSVVYPIICLYTIIGLNITTWIYRVKVLYPSRVLCYIISLSTILGLYPLVPLAYSLLLGLCSIAGLYLIIWIHAIIGIYTITWPQAIIRLYPIRELYLIIRLYPIIA